MVDYTDKIYVSYPTSFDATFSVILYIIENDFSLSSDSSKLCGTPVYHRWNWYNVFRKVKCKKESRFSQIHIADTFDTPISGSVLHLTP